MPKLSYAVEMDEVEKQRLAHLLRKNRRRNLTPEIVSKWRARGVAVSVLSDERQQELVARLRASTGPEQERAKDLQDVTRTFVGSASTLVIIDWEVNEEPALLVPAAAVLRTEADLRVLYPSGFVLLKEADAVIIDFEEHVGELQVTYRHLG